MNKIQYCPLELTDRQVDFVKSEYLELNWQGGMGRGKTTGLLAAAFRDVYLPEYRAILVAPDLSWLMSPAGLWEKSVLWVESFKDVRIRKSQRQISFPSGATISFLHNSRGIDQMRRMEAHFIGIDEIGCAVNQKEYLYSLTRLRSPISPFQPSLRMRTTQSITCDWRDDLPGLV